MAANCRRQQLSWIGVYLAFALVFLAVLWGIGLVYFVGSIPHRVADIDTITDAIVVLTGGSERLSTGLWLLSQNKAKRVFVSGVHPMVDVDKLIQLAGHPFDGLQQWIDAGHGAQDTHGNAEETAAWMHQRGYHSLRLVTGSYHMPRSLMEFREVLPEANVVPHPVFPDRVSRTSWWMRPRTAMLIIGEYNKYLFACFEHWCTSLLRPWPGPRNGQ